MLCHMTKPRHVTDTDLGGLLQARAVMTAPEIQEALGGISRVTFQMDSAELSHEQLLHSFELITNGVRPIVNRQNQSVEA